MSFKTGFNAAAAGLILYLIFNDAELSAKVATLTFWDTVVLFSFATMLSDAVSSGLQDIKKP